MLTYAVVETQVSVCLHVCHLSGPAVADRLNRSTLRRARLSARTSRPLTTVYANFQLPMCTAHIVTKWLVVSYTRLLTLTGRSRRLFSSALIKPHGLLRVRKRDALCCPDFPQISPGYQRQTVRLLFVCSAKLINSACFPIMLPYIFRNGRRYSAYIMLACPLNGHWRRPDGRKMWEEKNLLQRRVFKIEKLSRWR